MPRPKSLLPGKLQVDHAKQAHNCQNNSSHRIEKGYPRLKVPIGRSYEHYCASCALRFIARDIDTLNALAAELKGVA